MLLRYRPDQAIRLFPRARYFHVTIRHLGGAYGHLRVLRADRDAARDAERLAEDRAKTSATTPPADSGAST